ncbi:MAG: hypothetical protein DI626_00425 [Micavibrio aeruginosavorus]|uniref:ABC-type transport auxiliary lipoprotein component domain-containing protein n=1 Tax=Micavibrio aeruginosavorus TaxID=349221 RepID=A0A2W5A300_9BACT|nr:MAG: hypothetical protein DI626_00425 [Micavibrio aeruginosavorus]
MKKLIAIAGLSVLLTGCAGGGILTSTEPPQTIYALRAAENPNAVQGGQARVLEIAKPTLPPGFETDRIALYLDGGRTLDYYSGARWPDILDAVIQDFTRRTASNTLPYVVATLPNQNQYADYRLNIKLNEFQPVYGADSSGAPELVVDAEFTLVALPEEKIVQSFRLSKRGAAASNNLESVAGGLESILRQIEGEAFERMDKRLKGKR